MGYPPFELEEPAVTIHWDATETTLPDVLHRAGLRRRRAGEWEVPARALGERWTVVLVFAAAGGLRELRLEAPPEEAAPPEHGPPPALERQLAARGPGILRRRAALLRRLGAGQPLPTARTAEMPCTSMAWRDGGVEVVHEMRYLVERGSDEDGWIDDAIRIRAGA